MSFDHLIRTVPDFPKPGIQFRDITPLLDDPEALAAVIDRMAAPYQEAGIDKVVGIESRGFMFGAPLAAKTAEPASPKYSSSASWSCQS